MGAPPVRQWIRTWPGSERECDLVEGIAIPAIDPLGAEQKRECQAIARFANAFANETSQNWGGAARDLGNWPRAGRGWNGRVDEEPGGNCCPGGIRISGSATCSPRRKGSTWRSSRGVAAEWQGIDEGNTRWLGEGLQTRGWPSRRWLVSREPTLRGCLPGTLITIRSCDDLSLMPCVAPSPTRRRPGAPRAIWTTGVRVMPGGLNFTAST